MLRRIMIGLDTSAHAAILADLGIRLARKTGATLSGLTIVDEPGVRAIEPAFSVGGSPGVDPVYYLGYDARLATIREKNAEFLKQFAALCDGAGVAHAEVKGEGSPSEVIAAEAQSCDMFVVARGCRFRFTSRDDDGDAMIRRIVKDAPRPVIVAPENKCPEGPVLVAYDGSLQAVRAWRLSRQPGWPNRAECTC